MTGEDRMDKQLMRAQFEAAFVGRYGFGRLTASASTDAYAMYHAAWWAWQASREVVEVELPEPVEFDGYYNSGMAMWPCEVRSAIEAQGLKVKS